MESASQKGVKETKEMYVAVCKAISAGDKIAADGKVNFLDLPAIYPAAMALPGAISGVQHIPGELADLDPAEAEELKQLIEKELDLSNDAVEAVAEQIAGAVHHLAAAALAAKAGKASV